MCQRTIDNQSGFLTILLLILPILASLCISMGLLIFSWREQTATKHQCRIVALKSLQILADGMNDVLALNPLARKLQIKEKRALRMIQLAKGNPKALAVAVAYYQKVRLEQGLFRNKQLRIVSSSTTKANLYLQVHANKAALLRKKRITFLLKPDYSVSKFSPTYKALGNIERLQKISLSWRKLPTSHFKHLELSGTCHATLKEVDKWLPIVVMDKA